MKPKTFIYDPDLETYLEERFVTKEYFHQTLQEFATAILDGVQRMFDELEARWEVRFARLEANLNKHDKSIDNHEDRLFKIESGQKKASD
jgi:hypothetical protein